jgi:hypothetical protein
MMMSKILRSATVLVLLFLLLYREPSQAYPQVPTYKLEEMNRVLDEVRESKQLPDLTFMASPAEPSNQPAPSILLRRFEEVQKNVFKYHFLQLRYCVSCGVVMDYSQKTLFFGPTFFEHFQKAYSDHLEEYLDFKIAREFAVYIYGLSVDQGTRRSINGNRPLPEVEFDFDPKNPDRIKNAAERALVSAEMDVYALLIMKRMGHQKPNDLLKSDRELLQEMREFKKEKGEEAFASLGLSIQSYEASEAAKSQVIERLWRNKP